MRRQGTTLDSIYSAYLRRRDKPNHVMPGGEDLTIGDSFHDMGLVRDGRSYRQFVLGFDNWDDEDLWFGEDTNNAGFLAFASQVIKAQVGIAVELYGGPGAGGTPYTELNRFTTILAQTIVGLEHLGGMVETLFLTLLALTGETDTATFTSSTGFNILAALQAISARAGVETRSLTLLPVIAAQDGRGLYEQGSSETILALTSAFDGQGRTDLLRSLILLPSVVRSDTAQMFDTGVVVAKGQATDQHSVNRGETVGVTAKAQITASESQSQFSPSDVSGLVGFFMSDGNVWKITEDHSPPADSELCVDGDPVERWDDASGLGHHIKQLTLSKKPIYKTGQINSKPCIRFDGSNDFLKAVAFTLNQPVHIFMCFKQVGWTNGANILDGNTGLSLNLVQTDASAEVRLYAGTSNASEKDFGTGSFHIGEFLFNDPVANGRPKSIIQKDGDTPGTGFNIGTNNAGGLTIGKDGGDTFAAAQIDVAAIIVYNQALSSLDADLVRNYLNLQFAIY